MKIEVEKYAEALEGRLFFQPNFFEYGRKARLRYAERKSPLQFGSPTRELDELEIGLPSGFELEEATSPGAPINYDFVEFESYFETNEEGATLKCVKDLLDYGGEFSADSAAGLKQVWDEIHRQESQVLILREAGS